MQVRFWLPNNSCTYTGWVNGLWNNNGAAQRDQCCFVSTKKQRVQALRYDSVLQEDPSFPSELLTGCRTSSTNAKLSRRYARWVDRQVFDCYVCTRLNNAGQRKASRRESSRASPSSRPTRSFQRGIPQVLGFLFVCLFLFLISSLEEVVSYVIPRWQGASIDFNAICIWKFSWIERIQSRLFWC